MYNCLGNWVDNDLSEPHDREFFWDLENWQNLNDLKGGFMTSQD